MKRAVLALLVASAATLTIAVPAHAAHAAHAGQVGWSDYVLSVQSLSTGEARTVSLKCDPVGGTHPRAAQACAAIVEDGSIGGVQGSDLLCIQIYDPVIARATGAEDFEQEFPNACMLRSEKGAVFDF